MTGGIDKQSENCFCCFVELNSNLEGNKGLPTWAKKKSKEVLYKYAESNSYVIVFYLFATSYFLIKITANLSIKSCFFKLTIEYW